MKVEDIEEPVPVPAPALPPKLNLGHPSPPPPRLEHAHFHHAPAREPNTRSSPAHSENDDSSTPSSRFEEEPLPPEEDPPPHFQRDRSRPFTVGAVRRPTPELKGEEEQWGKRHHLNLTTPFTNALFSPSKDVHEHKVARTDPVSPKYRRDMKSRAPIFPADTPQSEKVDAKGSSHDRDGENVHSVHKEAKGKSRVKKLKVHAPKTVPLDLAKLEQRHYRSSPPAKKRGYHKSAYVRQTQDGPMCTVCGVNLDPLTAASQHRRTYTAVSHPGGHHPLSQDGSPQLRAPAVRECKGGLASPSLESVSSLSMTSCSVASEVLERARERRDHFWVE